MDNDSTLCDSLRMLQTPPFNNHSPPILPSVNEINDAVAHSHDLTDTQLLTRAVEACKVYRCCNLFVIQT